MCVLKTDSLASDYVQTCILKILWDCSWSFFLSIYILYLTTIRPIVYVSVGFSLNKFPVKTETLATVVRDKDPGVSHTWICLSGLPTREAGRGGGVLEKLQLRHNWCRNKTPWQTYMHRHNKLNLQLFLYTQVTAVVEPGLWIISVSFLSSKFYSLPALALDKDRDWETWCMWVNCWGKKQKSDRGQINNQLLEIG